MKTVRTAFVKEFGEKEADLVEVSAEFHANGINSQNKGDDPFKWAILICIGYECFLKDRYRNYHGFTAPTERLKNWIKEYGELATHNGDSDYLALFAGAYNEYMPSERKG